MTKGPKLKKAAGSESLRAAQLKEISTIVSKSQRQALGAVLILVVSLMESKREGKKLGIETISLIVCMAVDLIGRLEILKAREVTMEIK
jgi:hypothetical protein